ncbi:SWI/SNF chromatin-remodeling complex subunit [Coniosporium apollinis]|uniref:SWI/SNF chromatin-remodeling complex subunit n=2 Tax=Coniosporium TaxID=2810619 RepID=A0ABQ9NZW9_9PEZI|nr:SWI/SNF chromatin-remodeling complex subunit [Coniosporium apollinis]
MLSPANNTPTAEPFRAPHTVSQNAPGAYNGSVGNGAVAESAERAGAVTGAMNTIAESKEKARAVMAASGVGLAGARIAQTRTPPTSNPQRVTDAANGAPPSRKRSRSGSPKPAHPASATMAQPPQPDAQAYLLNKYIERDELHDDAVIQQQRRVREFFEEKQSEIKYYKDLRHQRQTDPGSVFGYGYAGYGNGYTDVKPSRLEYPTQRKRVPSRRSRSVRVPRKDMNAQAEQLEELVPVRLDIELEKLKLRDTFTWNLHDRTITPELFAENLVEDFKIPPEHSANVMHQINREIQEQTQDFYPHVFIEEEPLDPHLPYHAYKNDEMRILIKLNITIGAHTLVDQFEWDINNPLNLPEEFARSMARDLNLSGEFTTAIAHSIREQCQMFTKSLYITGHPFDGRPVEDADVRDSFLPSPLPAVFRPQQAMKDFSPYLYELNEAELEKTELSILREQRRQKRSTTRRGGLALPDLKEWKRTVRTQVVSSVIPGAAETIESSRLYKIARRPDGRGRRAAGRTDGAEDSDDSEDEDSAPESPAPSQVTGGTARTRVIRGAATAAQAAMRANLGRSMTPEIAALDHVPTRISRRLVGLDARDESEAPASLIVKLRVPHERFRDLLQGKRIKPGQNKLSAPQAGSQSGTPQRSTPATSMPPPPSPAMQQQRNTPSAASSVVPEAPRSIPRSVPNEAQQRWQYYPDGRVDVPPNWQQGQPVPPPPPWLTAALANLRRTFPHDSVAALMRFAYVDKTTNLPIMREMRDGPPPPGTYKMQFMPRIRCNDCPGKLYTAGPELTTGNFEVHLINRKHKERVDARRRGVPPPS